MLTLENYGISGAGARRSLCDWAAHELAEQGTHVMAWVAMALNPLRTWPAGNTVAVQ
jgi:hypothetical protein